MTLHRDFSGQQIRRPLQLRSFDAVLAELEHLQTARGVVLSPGWDLPRTFDHCARSIEYSVTGFPRLRPAVFRAVIGPAVFRVFDVRGRMNHDVTAEVPGDRAPEGILTLEHAVERLQQTIQQFDAWRGRLQPHFAYGTLTKAQYERAHAMHIANHLSTLSYRL